MILLEKSIFKKNANHRQDSGIFRRRVLFRLTILHYLKRNSRFYENPGKLWAKRSPYAMLSCDVAGFIKNTLVITLPGSPKGVAEDIGAIFPYVLHVFCVKESVKPEGKQSNNFV